MLRTGSARALEIQAIAFASGKTPLRENQALLLRIYGCDIHQKHGAAMMARTEDGRSASSKNARAATRRTRRGAMWEQYKKTFVGQQLVIAVISVMVFQLSHHLLVPTLAFFGMMQLGAFAGAAWGARLRRKILEARALRPRVAR
jgi:hypothetical protein